MSKRAEVRERRRRKKQRERLTWGFIIAGVVLIIAAIIIMPYLQPVGDIIIPPSLDRSMVDGNSIGDPNAPVVLEEFSDFQCGHCRNFSENVEPQLIKEYVASGELYIVYKALPLYPSSIPISEASLCARDQGKFWEYKDIVYANQNSNSSNPYSTRRLSAFAESIGLDVEAFDDCVGDRMHKDEVEQIMLEAQDLEVTGTPTFFVNGKLLRGNQPIEVFREEIEVVLAAVGR
jgi:protein-disulfide isomerase